MAGSVGPERLSEESVDLRPARTSHSRTPHSVQAYPIFAKNVLSVCVRSTDRSP